MQSDPTLQETMATAVPAQPTPIETLAPSAEPVVCTRKVLAARYELLGLVGVGGMGNVYRARDIELDEVVALKVLRAEIGNVPEMVERFRREVRLARRVTHPNVARVFDIGEHEGDKFLTMEFVEGESLAAVLSRERLLPLDRVVEIMRAVCAGLSAAHQAGVIHRDLKPDNVLLAPGGRVVLTDFGIARALDGGLGGSTLGTAIGTPAYMAPEQVQGTKDIDARADVYALGAMLYELFTGERPWQAEGPFAIAAARLLADPPDPRRKRPDLPDAFARLVLRCMARSRDDRLASADLVAAELASLTQPAALSSPEASVSVRTAPPPGGEPPVSEPDAKTVAVLPFRNQGDPADAYLADELTDELTDTLSMTRGLRVQARGAVMRWKGADQDPREIGREIGVMVVVDGSVRRRAGMLRVSARLICIRDGFQLWARRIERPDGEALRVSDEIAQAIAEALTIQGAPKACREAPTDPEAIDLFLRGRHAYRRFWPQHLQRATALYEQALARAPNDPMILSAYALARARLWHFTGEGQDIAAGAATRAAALAPQLPEAHLAVGSVRFQEGDVIEAVRQFRRALALSPGLSEAQSSLGRILLEVGAVEQGLHWVEMSLLHDPETPLAAHALSRGYALLGRWADADATIERSLELEESAGVWIVGVRLALWRRDLARAQALHQRAAAAREHSIDYASTLFSHLLDARGVVTPRLKELMFNASPSARRAAFLAQLHAEVSGYLGHTEEMIEALQRSVEGGLIDLLWLERCPLLDEARRDPRFGPVHAEVKQRADAVLAAYRER